MTQGDAVHEAIFAQTMGGIALTDLEGRVVTVNRSLGDDDKPAYFGCANLKSVKALSVQPW